MSVQNISISQEFNAPVETVFGTLTDHESFGNLMSGAQIIRVVDSTGDNVNGTGSVRSIKMPLAPAFEETVVSYEKDKLMEYTISKGSPIKNHLGRMIFSEQNGKTKLHYTIQLESKIPVPFLGPILKLGVEKTISSLLSKLAAQ
ncbi:MAG: SRPBCC family protein, partial [Pseudomonadales bacterium]|nr:SRPBCC family protein [Pseudomonadales bacterium]